MASPSHRSAENEYSRYDHGRDQRVDIRLTSALTGLSFSEDNHALLLAEVVAAVPGSTSISRTTGFRSGQRPRTRPGTERTRWTRCAASADPHRPVWRSSGYRRCP